MSYGWPVSCKEIVVVIVRNFSIFQKSMTIQNEGPIMLSRWYVKSILSAVFWKPLQNDIVNDTVMIAKLHKEWDEWAERSFLLEKISSTSRHKFSYSVPSLFYESMSTCAPTIKSKKNLHVRWQVRQGTEWGKNIRTTGKGSFLIYSITRGRPPG